MRSACAAWVAAILLAPCIAVAQPFFPPGPTLPPFGPLGNGIEGEPPDNEDADGSIDIFNVGSDIRVDFLGGPGPMELEALLAGTVGDGFTLTVNIFSNTPNAVTAQLINPIPPDNPTAPGDLVYSATEPYSVDQIEGNATGQAALKNWLYEAGMVTITLPSVQPLNPPASPDGTLALNGPLGNSIPSGTVFDLFDVATGVLKLGWGGDDPFFCGTSGCVPFDVRTYDLEDPNGVLLSRRTRTHGTRTTPRTRETSAGRSGSTPTFRPTIRALPSPRPTGSNACPVGTPDSSRRASCRSPAPWLS